MAKITEGYMPFHGYQTYYRIVGEQKDNGKAPLICLHGGPGSTHNYFEVLDNVADDDDRMIIMYDHTISWVAVNLTWMDIRRCGHRIFGWMNWMH